MLFPIIKIKEQMGNKEIGHILDVQCMSGTQHPEESGMRFQGVDSEYPITGHPEIEFVTLEELIDIAAQFMKEQTQATINTYEMTRKYLDYLAEQERCKNALDECKGKTGINADTSGNLF